MKVVIVLVALLGLSLAAPSAKPTPFGLSEDLQSLAAHVDTDAMREVLRKFYNGDKDVQDAIKYLQGPIWAELVATVAAHDTWIGFKAWCFEEGVDLQKAIDEIHNLIAGIEFQDTTASLGGFRALVDECGTHIDTDGLVATLNGLLGGPITSPFNQFWGKVTSTDSYEFVEWVRTIDEVQRLSELLIAAGIDVKGTLAFIYELFGWPAPTVRGTRGLAEDLQSLAAHVDTDAMREVLRKFYNGDKDVQDAIKYLQGPIWAELVATVAAHDTWIGFKAWCFEEGVDLQKAIDEIHNLIAGIEFQDTTASLGGFRALVDECGTHIDTDGLVATLNGLLGGPITSPFNQFWGKVTSADSYEFVEWVRTIDEVQRLSELLIAAGIDVKGTLAFIYELFGWPAPTVRGTRGLAEDLQSLAAHVDTDAMREVLRKFYNGDKDVQDAIKYLQGPIWAELVATVAAHDTWIGFKAWCFEEGVDLQKAIDEIHNLIAGIEFQDTTASLGGFRALVDECGTHIDTDGLVATLNGLLGGPITSPFNQFWGKVTSADSYEFVEWVRTIDEVQRLSELLIAAGIDVKGTLAFIYELFGWPAPTVRGTRGLAEDLQSLAAHVDTDAMREVLRKFYNGDKDVQDAIKYLQGPIWAELVATVAAHDTWIGFKAWCFEEGVDLQKAIDEIHNLIAGIEFQDTTASLGGFRALVDECGTHIDTDGLVATLNGLLGGPITSPFNQFWGKVTSTDSYEFVEWVRTIDEVQRLSELLIAAGIDVKGTLAFIYELFGWPAPTVRGTRGLAEDLQSLAAHVDTDAMREVLRKFYNGDKDVQDAIKYLQGPIWAELVATVAAHDTWIGFKAWCFEEGVDLQKAIDEIHNLIAGIEFQDTTASLGGFRALVDECGTHIDTDGLVATLNGLLGGPITSPFNQFWGKVTSTDSYEFVEWVRTIDEVQRLSELLIAAGIDVKGTLAFIYELFGWPAP